MTHSIGLTPLRRLTAGTIKLSAFQLIYLVLSKLLENITVHRLDISKLTMIVRSASSISAVCCKLSSVLVTVIIFHVMAFAQSRSTENVVFQSLTINDGLSQGMVTRILQDGYGFMWFATKDGLNQYDGYHFKIFRHDTEDTTSLADSYVQTMTEDSQGRIWVGTASGSLDVFHRETETFEHIKLQNNISDLEKPGAVYNIIQDAQGTVWVLCTNRLFIIPIPVIINKQFFSPLNFSNSFNGNNVLFKIHFIGTIGEIIIQLSLIF